jgi:hypothetical protein
MMFLLGGLCGLGLLGGRRRRGLYGERPIRPSDASSETASTAAIQSSFSAQLKVVDLWEMTGSSEREDDK